MDMDALKVELLAGHPNTGAYDVDNIVAARQLNAVNRSRDKTSMTGSEILNALDKAEYLALSDADQGRVWQVCHLNTANPFGIEADQFIGIFGIPSVSITSLQAARAEAISRATELGLGFIKAGYIQQARA